MNCEKQVGSKVLIFTNLNKKYGKNYTRFIASYNKIHGYTETTKEIGDVYDNIECTKCGKISRMRRVRKKNVTKNRTCKECKCPE